MPVCDFIIVEKLTFDPGSWKEKLLVWEAGAVWVQSDQCSEHLGWECSLVHLSFIQCAAHSVRACVRVHVRAQSFSPVQLCNPVDRSQASQVALVVKNPSASAGDIRDVGSIPGSGRSPGGGHGNPLVFLPGKSHGRKSLVSYSP